MNYVSTSLKKEIEIFDLIVIHYFEYMKDFIFHGESHDFWEFLYVDKGRILVQADDVMYQLNSGSIIFHQPNEFHAMRSLGDKAPNLVAISFRTSSPAMDFFIHKQFILTQHERSLISQIILEAKNAFSTPLHIPSILQVIPALDAPFGSQQLISLYLELFFITLRRRDTPLEQNTLDPFAVSSAMKKPLDSDRMDKILQYMEYHICEQLTIDQICKDFSLSRSALQALFHREKQCGAIEYFHGRKLELAREIMREGTMNLTEIAHYLSYSSLQHFSNQFKKATGMSPLEYSTSVKGMSQKVKKRPIYYSE